MREKKMSERKEKREMRVSERGSRKVRENWT
jgi:hypothetical protein